MRRLLKKYGLAILLAGCSGFTNLNAQTNYYVNDGSTIGDVYTGGIGNDANPGTSALPKATVQAVIGLGLLPGDSVFIDVGTYSNQFISATGLTGSAGAPIVFIGADSATTHFTNNVAAQNTIDLINSQYTVWQNLRLEITGAGDGKAIYINGNSDNNEIKYCRIINGYYAVDILSTSKTDIPNNNLIHNNYLEAQYVVVRIKADRTTIGEPWIDMPQWGPLNNEIYDNKIVNTGIGGTSAFSVIELHAIEDNEIYRNVIVMESGIDAWGLIFLAHGVSGNTITNNYFLNFSNLGTKNYGVYVDDIFDYSLDFQHNSIYSKQACFYAPSGAAGFTFNNNILYSEEQECMLFSGNQKLGECINNYYYFPNGTLATTATPITSVADWQTYNPDNSNNAINALGGSTPADDPQFIDINAWNLDLSCSSLALDGSFNPLLSVVDDIHGNPRPLGVRLDIGAYEGALVYAGTFQDPEQRLCTGTTANLNLVGFNTTGTANWEQSLDGSIWTAGGPGFVQLNDTAGTATHTNVGTSPDTVWYRVHTTGMCNSDTSDVASIVIDPNPTAGTLQSDDTICDGASSTLTVTGNNGDSIYWQSAVTSAGPWTNTSGTGTPNIVSPSTDQSYRAVVKYSSGTCLADTTSSVDITVDPNAIPGSIAGASICLGDSTTLTISGLTGDTIIWQQATVASGVWSTITGENQTSITVTPPEATNYRALVGLLNNVCDSDTTALALVNLTSVTPSVSISLNGNPVCIEGGQLTANISTVVNGGSTPDYEWYLNGSAIGVNDTTVTITNPTEGDQLYAELISSLGCATDDTVQSATHTINAVQCQCDLYIPSGFSPNGDGMNDAFEIKNIDCYSDIIFNIYNRWGTIVYTSNDVYIPWDGTREGKEMPIATYYYVLQADGIDARSGSVTIIR